MSSGLARALGVGRAIGVLLGRLVALGWEGRVLMSSLSCYGGYLVGEAGVGWPGFIPQLCSPLPVALRAT